MGLILVRNDLKNRRKLRGKLLLRKNKEYLTMYTLYCYNNCAQQIAITVSIKT